MSSGRDEPPRVAILLPKGGDAVGSALPEQSHDEVVSNPSRIFRLATMAQAMLSEIREIELDEAARHRFALVYNRTIQAMNELLSDDLKEELRQLDLHVPEDATESELRVAQAQLVGWLEGLFHGIRTAMIAHNLATQEELARAFQRGVESERHEGTERNAGQYL